MESLIIIVLSVAWMIYKILNSMGADINTQSTYDQIHQRIKEKKEHEEYIKQQQIRQQQKTQNIISDLASKKIKAKHMKTPIGE